MDIYRMYIDMHTNSSHIVNHFVFLYQQMTFPWELFLTWVIHDLILSKTTSLVILVQLLRGWYDNSEFNIVT